MEVGGSRGKEKPSAVPRRQPRPSSVAHAAEPGPPHGSAPIPALPPRPPLPRPRQLLASLSPALSELSPYRPSEGVRPVLLSERPALLSLLHLLLSELILFISCLFACWLSVCLSCLPLYLPHLEQGPAQSRCFINICQTIGQSFLTYSLLSRSCSIRISLLFHLQDTIHPSPRYLPPVKSKPKPSVAEILFGTRQHVNIVCRL